MDFCPVDYHSSSESIASIFFNVVISNLKTIQGQEIKTHKKDLFPIMGNSIKALWNIYNLNIGELIDNISDIKKSISNADADFPIDIIRANISEILSSSRVKIVVVIDDIDRLLPGEAMQILKLLRITANFDNMFYVLGYDQNILSKQIDPLVGDEYLQKFVQVPIQLPEPSKLIIDDMLNNEFVKTIALYGYAPCRYSSSACHSISLRTVRELGILLNKFRIKLAIIPRDVCPEDLLVLTFIEMKSLDVYHWISDNRHQLCRIHNEELQFVDLNGAVETERSLSKSF